jgi:hypothetical protein
MEHRAWSIDKPSSLLELRRLRDKGQKTMDLITLRGLQRKWISELLELPKASNIKLPKVSNPEFFIFNS